MKSVKSEMSVIKEVERNVEFLNQSWNVYILTFIKKKKKKAHWSQTLENS